MRSISNLLAVVAQIPGLDMPTRDRARELLWHLDRYAWTEVLLGRPVRRRSWA